MIATQPVLTEKEWSLVLELLQLERGNLPVEIRHTDSPEYADQLDERRAIVTSLIDRLQAQGISA